MLLKQTVLFCVNLVCQPALAKDWIEHYFHSFLEVATKHSCRTNFIDLNLG